MKPLWKHIRRTTPLSRGFAVLFASLVAALVLSLGLAVFNITSKEFSLASQVRDSQLAVYAADAGIECALYWDLAHPDRTTSPFGAFVNTLSQGLVAYWRLDDGNGVTARDTADGHDGRLYNMISGLAWTDDKVGGGLAFDGDNDFVRVPDDVSLRLEEYTYAFWMRTDEPPTSQWRQILIKGNGAVAGQRTPGLWLQPDDMRVHAGHSEAEGGQVALSSTRSVPLGAWAHIALTSTGDAGRLALYLNGALSSAASHAADLIPNTTDLFIGDSPNYADSLNGELDEIRVYDRALSPQEVAALANLSAQSAFTPPAAASSDAPCDGADITDPGTGWNASEGWVVSPVSGTGASVWFDMAFDNDRCATVVVEKKDGATRIESRGYNTCDTNSRRRVERAFRVLY